MRRRRRHRRFPRYFCHRFSREYPTAPLVWSASSPCRTCLSTRWRSTPARSSAGSSRPSTRSTSPPRSRTSSRTPALSSFLPSAVRALRSRGTSPGFPAEFPRRGFAASPPPSLLPPSPPLPPLPHRQHTTVVPSEHCWSFAAPPPAGCYASRKDGAVPLGLISVVISGGAHCSVPVLIVGGEGGGQPVPDTSD